MVVTSSHHKVILVHLFIIIFAVHLLYVFFVQLPQRETRLTGRKTPAGGFYHLALFDDEYDYVTLAHHLSRQGVFTLNGRQPTAGRVPLYPLLLAPVLVFTANAAWVLWINCLLTAIAALGCYFLGRLYWSPRAGLIAMALAGFSPHTFNWFLWLQAEALLSVLLIYFLVSLTCLIKSPNQWYASGSGILAGLAALTRPEAVLLIPLYLVYLWYHFRRSWRPGGRLVLVYLICAGAVIAPWVGRNYAVLKFPGLSSLGGFTFAGGQNEKTLAHHPGSWYAFGAYASAAELKKTAALSEIDFDRYLWQRGWRIIQTLTWPQFLFLEINKLHRTFKPSFRAWGKEFNCERLNLILVTPYFLLYLSFGVLLISCVLIRSQPAFPDLVVLLLSFLVPLTVTLIFWGAIRFRTPYEPVAFTICAGYLDKFLGKKYN